MFKQMILSSLVAAAFASPVNQVERQSCPQIHVFGARETTVSPGYGSAGTVVNDILNAHPGSTAEAINYPACGGQSSCGDVSYSASVEQGTSAVVSQVSAYAAKCPGTYLVLVGYSQVSPNPVDRDLKITQFCDDAENSCQGR